MPSIYRPRRPRASPVWQVVHHCWSDFVTGYEQRHRPIHGPLRRDAVDVVRQFHRCGDLAAGFTRHGCGVGEMGARKAREISFKPKARRKELSGLND